MTLLSFDYSYPLNISFWWPAFQKHKFFIHIILSHKLKINLICQVTGTDSHEIIHWKHQTKYWSGCDCQVLAQVEFQSKYICYGNVLGAFCCLHAGQIAVCELGSTRFEQPYFNNFVCCPARCWLLSRAAWLLPPVERVGPTSRATIKWQSLGQGEVIMTNWSQKKNWLWTS